MTGYRDPYEVLGLPRGASPAQIRSAWRAAARLYHPDSNPADVDLAAERFAEAKEAFELLQATVIDAQRSTPPQADNPNDAPAPESAEPGTFQPAAATPRVKHDPFASHAGSPRRGADLAVHAPMTLATAIGGGHVSADLDYDVTCPACAGTGPANCSCHGTGLVPVRARQVVQVPAGAAPGSVLRLLRRGAPGAGGEAPGDLEVTLDLDDPVWQARGHDLVAHVAISTASALRGVRLRLPHPTQLVQIDVPPDTMDELVVEVPGAGIGTSAHVHVRRMRPNLEDQRVQRALADLDRAERSTM